MDPRDRQPTDPVSSEALRPVWDSHANPHMLPGLMSDAEAQHRDAAESARPVGALRAWRRRNPGVVAVVCCAVGALSLWVVPRLVDINGWLVFFVVMVFTGFAVGRGRAALRQFRWKQSRFQWWLGLMAVVGATASLVIWFGTTIMVRTPSP